MKFMLRQVKALDYSLPHDPTASVSTPLRRTRQSVFGDRAAISRDELGETVLPEEMDVALLVLYGHILYSGNSFYPALNYFFRAYALDDENPAVLLSIALCYINHSMKRQSENRHYLIMQGLSFMQEYRRVREKEGTLIQERQEMEFNFARVYHSLGLAHLAVEGYKRVLTIGEQIRSMQAPSKPEHQPEPSEDHDVAMEDEAETNGTTTPRRHDQPDRKNIEDFSSEAAMALQTIYALSGDLLAAKEVTEKWLVI